MPAGLTPRELECLRLTAIMTDKEIARHLGIAPKTVSQHVSSANHKLGTQGRRAAFRALGENAHPALSPMEPGNKTAPAEGASEVDQRSRDEERAQPVRMSGFLASAPTDVVTKSIWIVFFALLAIVLMAGGVSVVASIMGLVSTFAPASAP